MMGRKVIPLVIVDRHLLRAFEPGVLKGGAAATLHTLEVSDCLLDAPL